jgi:hypothetical protein
MIEQTTWSSNNEINTFCQLVGFCPSVRTTHNDAEGLRVEGHEFFRYAEDLQGKFSRWRDDDNPGSCLKTSERGSSQRERCTHRCEA